MEQGEEKRDSLQQLHFSSLQTVRFVTTKINQDSSKAGAQSQHHQVREGEPSAEHVLCRAHR